MGEQQELWLREAIAIATENVRHGGGPFGALVVKDGKVIGRGVNRVTARHDPTAHAEVTAIREACATLGTHDLSGCELYASCEPCPMCLGAALWSRVDKLYYAATRFDAAAAGFDDAHFYRILDQPELLTRFAHHHNILESLAPFNQWAEEEDKELY